MKTRLVIAGLVLVIASALLAYRAGWLPKLVFNRSASSGPAPSAQTTTGAAQPTAVGASGGPTTDAGQIGAPVTQTPGATAVRDALVKVASGAAPLTPLIVTYDDLHALHGGLTLTIHGDGTIEQTVQRVAAGTPRGKVLREDCLRLVSLLVKREAWVQLVADRTMVPDESRIFLRIAYGTDLVEIWEWYDSQESAGRIAGIRELMKDIAWQDRKKTYRD